jgi:hypothetical protein
VTKPGSAASGSERSSTGNAFENSGWHWKTKLQRCPLRGPQETKPDLRPLAVGPFEEQGTRKGVLMYIQYTGFHPETDSRTYTFHVIDPPQETREFTVNVCAEAFRTPPFKTQDGPGISMVRLKQELERETQESRAETCLQIGPGDIREYVARNYPKPGRKWGPGKKS